MTISPQNVWAPSFFQSVVKHFILQVMVFNLGNWFQFWNFRDYLLFVVSTQTKCCQIRDLTVVRYLIWLSHLVVFLLYWFPMADSLPPSVSSLGLFVSKLNSIKGSFMTQEHCTSYTTKYTQTSYTCLQIVYLSCVVFCLVCFINKMHYSFVK